MRVCCIADPHGWLPPDVPACDILLIAGDIGPDPEASAGWFFTSEFKEWLEQQPADEIIAIAGNHDRVAERRPACFRELPWRYLENEVIETHGLTIAGSPYSPGIFWAFARPDPELARLWRTIPNDTDILLVHGPPYGFLDRTVEGRHAGSQTLRERIDQLRDLKLVCFGHVHESAGWIPIKRGAVAVNASLVDASYDLVNRPILVDVRRGDGRQGNVRD